MRVLYWHSKKNLLYLVPAVAAGIIVAVGLIMGTFLYRNRAVPVFAMTREEMGIGPLMLASEKSETTGSMIWMLTIKAAISRYEAGGEGRVSREALSYLSDRIRATEPHLILASGVSGLSQVAYQPASTQITISPEIVTDPEPPEDITTTPVVVGQGPLVAIYHTHNSESFVPDSGLAHVYNNPELTVVRVGLELARELEQRGARVIHSAEDHVRSAFDQSYTRSLATVTSILGEYPQVDYVLDVHRDALARSLSTTIIEGERVARIYIVVGTNEVLGHSNWRTNHSLAMALHATMERLYPGFSRGILLRPLGRYNQHVHPRSILIEIGGHENSMAEALRATKYLAECIMAMDKEIRR